MICHRPTKYGLGDFISITQYCNATGKNHLTSEGIYDKEKFRSIIALFDNDLVVTDKCEMADPIAPHWEYDVKLEYKKASCIESVKKQDYVSISLIPSTFSVPNYRNIGRGLSDKTIHNILKFIDAKYIINLSQCEFKSSRIKNCYNRTLEEKLNIIAASKLHISVDTGISHLAAMTYTPTIIIAPLVVYNRYVGNKNLHLTSNFEKFKNIFHSLVK